MLKPSMIIALLVATSSAPPVIDPPTQPVPPRTTTSFATEAERARSDAAASSESLPIARDATERMTVPVDVSGKGPFAFLVDTGSERTAISRQLATDLGLANGTPVRVHSLLGTELVGTVHIPRLKVGRQALSIADAPTFEARHIGASGILGIDSLRSQRVVFDFKAGTMHIAHSREPDVSVDRDTIVVRARTRNGRLVLTKVMLDGIAIAAVIDTGAQLSIGNRPLWRKLYRARRLASEPVPDGAAPRRPRLETVTGQSRTVDIAMVERLDLGDVVMQNVAVAFADAQVFEELGLGGKPAILLGINALRSFDRVSIDFAQKKVRFVIPTVAAAGPPRTAGR